MRRNGVLVQYRIQHRAHHAHGIGRMLHLSKAYRHQRDTAGPDIRLAAGADAGKVHFVITDDFGNLYRQ